MAVLLVAYLALALAFSFFCLIIKKAKVKSQKHVLLDVDMSLRYFMFAFNFLNVIQKALKFFHHLDPGNYYFNIWTKSEIKNFLL